MIRFRSISMVLAVAALSVSAHAQGTTGGLLYASDFANWSLPQGNTPMQGAIIYPNQTICQVTSNGYTFLAPKVGRPIMIVDGVNTETVTPTSVVVGPVGCMISATMAHAHSSYSIKSGTGGAQEAIDYQAALGQGSQVVLTPAWTGTGGTTGILNALKGNNGVTILDQRTAQFVPYTWNGSAFIAQPFSGGSVALGSSYQVPCYPLNPTAALAPCNLTADATGNNLLVPGSVTAATAVLGSMNNLSNLASQTGSGSTNQLNAWIAAQIGAGTRGVLWADPQAAAGGPTSAMVSGLQFWDTRGTNSPSPGGNTTNLGAPNLKLADGATSFYSAWDRQLSWTAAQYMGNLNFGFDCRAGGVYNFTAAGGTKTFCNDVNITLNSRTQAQHHGILMFLTGYAGGEDIPLNLNQTEYGGFIGGGQEPHEGLRIQQQQTSSTDSVGGIWNGTVTNVNGGTGVVTFTANSNGATLGETRFIRDLNAPYTTGTIASTSGTGTPTTTTLVGSGTTWTSIAAAGSIHTTWDTGNTGSGATTNILTNNLVLCFGPGANDGYDMCVPITQIVDDTHLTVNLAGAGTAGNTGWTWGSTGSYAIYHSAYPGAVDLAAGTFTACSHDHTGAQTCDASGIGSGHTVDQVLAYNADFQIMQLLQKRHIGRQYGGGINLENISTSTAPAFLYGLSVSGNYFSVIDMQPSNPGSGVPANFLYLNTNPTDSVIQSNDTTGSSTSILKFRDSTAATFFGISINKSNPGTPLVNIYGTKTAGKFTFDPNGNSTQAGNQTVSGQSNIVGNLNVGGTFVSPNVAAGPYANQIICSQFQSSCIAAQWAINSGTGTMTANQDTDVLGATTAAAFANTGAVSVRIIQPTAISMVTTSTYAMTVYARALSGTVTMVINLNTAGGNTACTAVGGGIPSSYQVTTTLQKFTAYCAPTINDTMKVSIQNNTPGSTLYLSNAQVAGTPYCDPAVGSGCTTTGPLVITLASPVSGTGSLVLGLPQVLGAGIGACGAGLYETADTVSGPTCTKLPDSVIKMTAQQVFTATGSNSPAVLYSLGIPIANLTSTTTIEVKAGGHSASGSTACAFAANIGSSSATVTGSGINLISSITPASAGSWFGSGVVQNLAAPSSSTSVALSSSRSTTGVGSLSTSGTINESATACGSTGNLCINIQVTDAVNAEVCTLDTAIVRVNW